ncbi:hypothetical protein EDB85DRAFT_1899268 [Lactarius pseudohatsudake]|nr:hypothetical protein EDB85DRAFT_1899268 [Lactarius pseudohatsudake]
MILMIPCPSLPLSPLLPPLAVVVVVVTFCPHRSLWPGLGWRCCELTVAGSWASRWLARGRVAGLRCIRVASWRVGGGGVLRHRCSHCLHGADVARSSSLAVGTCMPRWQWRGLARRYWVAPQRGLRAVGWRGDGSCMSRQLGVGAGLCSAEWWWWWTCIWRRMDGGGDDEVALQHQSHQSETIQVVRNKKKTNSYWRTGQKPSSLSAMISYGEVPNGDIAPANGNCGHTATLASTCSANWDYSRELLEASRPHVTDSARNHGKKLVKRKSPIARVFKSAAGPPTLHIKPDTFSQVDSNSKVYDMSESRKERKTVREQGAR